MHSGITLWGAPRTITFEQTDEAEPLIMTTKAGHVYMGSICGPRHRVCHSGGAPGDFHNCSSLGLVEVVLLLRSACFRKTRGTIRPNPVVMYEAALESLVSCLQSVVWRLPTLAECMEAELALHLG